MDTLGLAILAGLAAYRAARLIVAEDGPWDAFARLRQSMDVARQDTWVKRGLGCMACVSFWAAFVFALPVSAGPSEFVLIWLAGGGVAVALGRRVG